MRTSDILLTIFILGIFFSLYFINISIVGVQSIKDNWDQYKCNPAIIPFAWLFGKDTKSNMMDCVDNIQSNSFADALLPFEYVFNLFGDAFSCQQKSMSSSFSILTEIRDTILSIFTYFISFISNIIFESQKILLVVKDTLKKCIGVVITFLHAINTMLTLTESALNSSLVKTVFKLGDFVTHFQCFHPDTMLRLNSDTCKKISDITFDDILCNNNKITSIHKILNINKNPMYKINNVLVTGNHYVKYKNKWIYVKNHPNSTISTLIPEYVYCIGTKDNTIIINDTIFHDWNDDYISKKDISIKNLCNCFSEKTYIETNKHFLKSIKNININDVLIDNNKVIGISKFNHINNLVISNNKKIICDSKQDIIYNNNYINAEDHPDFTQYNKKTNDIMYSLITTKENIKIDKYTFKDSL